MLKPLTLARILVVWLSVSAICSAQKENNIWFFGNHAGINFNTSPPTPITTSPLTAWEGTSSICDPATGALLFYTDGVSVWNRTNTLMPNGTNLHGGASSSQSALIVRQPGSSTRYYIFTAATLEGNQYIGYGIQYSIVDLALDGGRGDIISKNVPLLAPSTERITGIQDCSGQNAWILAVKWSSNEFHAYRLTDTGLVTTPVISPLGLTTASSLTPQGWLQPSPNGSNIAIASLAVGGKSQVCLYDFDRLTGTISHQIIVDTSENPHYGICFSPDNSKLYFASVPDTLWQCDLSSGNEASIIASKTRINTVDGSSGFGAIQLGPDGKLYVAHPGNFVGTILYPNKAGTACQYVHDAFSVAPEYLFIGLNNYVYPNSRSSVGVVTVSPDTAVCAGSPAFLSASGGATYAWYPTDNLSCAYCPNPVALPTTTTTYYVKIIADGGCWKRDSVTVTTLPLPRVSSVEDTTVCFGDSVRLTAFGALSYRWSPAAGLSCTTCTSPFATPLTKTTYTVIGSNANGCSDTASVTISVDPPLDVDAGNDTIICLGAEAHLHAEGPSQFRWEPTDGLSCSYCSDPIARPKQTTTYVAIGWNLGECHGVDSVTVTVNPPPNVDADPTLSVCLGDTVRLHASGADAFSWTPTTGLSCSDCPDPLARPVATTTYTVTGLDSIGCAASDTVTVIVGSSVTALVDGETTICAGDSAQLHASGGTRFDWYPISGLSCSDCPDPLARPDSTTTYTVRVSANGNCVGTDSASLTVTVLPKPTITVDGNFVICQDGTTQLTASGGTSYRWSPDLYLSCSDCPDPVVTPATTTTYTLLVGTEGGCLDSTSVTVVVNEPPTIDLGEDRTICSGTSTKLQTTGASSYSWSPTEGLSCSDCAEPVASPAVTTTYHVVGLDNAGCSATDSVTVTVLPTFSVDAGPDTTICPTGVAMLNAPEGDYSYQWSPVDGLSCPTCRTTEARPKRATTYTLTVTDADGCSASDTVRVIVDTSSNIVHAHIARDYHLGPGSIADLIVSLDDPLPDVRDLDLSFRYDPSIVQLRQIRRTGTLTEFWEVRNENNDRANGRYTVQLHGSDGTDLTSGTLLHLIFSGYVGPVDSSEVTFQIGLPGVECLSVVTRPGLVRIDSLCGLSLRLIEINAENYALDENRPNPFNPTTEIGFSLGMDGPTRLEIFDASGRKVATLVDEHLGPGRYVVTWDATEYPSGVYYCRLSSGAWSKSEVMMLMK